MIPLELSNHSGAAAVGPRQSTSAQTRFNNDRIKAKRQGLSPDAQSSLPLQGNRSRPPAHAPRNGLAEAPQIPGGTNNVAQRSITSYGMGTNNGLSPVGLGQVQPQVSIQDLQADVAFEYFLSSPELQQAVSTSKLRQYFKRDNPTGAEATLAMDVIQSMLSRVP